MQQQQQQQDSSPWFADFEFSVCCGSFVDIP